MRRLNVQFSQIEACIRSSLFGLQALPQNPPMEPGEVLLLQLTKTDALRLGRLERRVEFALIFDRATRDETGSLSREHWPHAESSFRYIIHCRETVATVPFSLENLGLSKNYQGQSNAVLIDGPDEERIRPYLLGQTSVWKLPEITSVEGLLAAIRNHDQVVQQAPVRTTQVAEHQRRLRDPWLGDALKQFYDHRCQVCVNDFKPLYGVPYADVKFIKLIGHGGEPISRNLLVLCPNHNAITAAANADFDRRTMAFLFPNGLVEKLTLRDHLL